MGEIERHGVAGVRQVDVITTNFEIHTTKNRRWCDHFLGSWKRKQTFSDYFL